MRLSNLEYLPLILYEIRINGDSMTFYVSVRITGTKSSAGKT